MYLIKLEVAVCLPQREFPPQLAAVPCNCVIHSAQVVLAFLCIPATDL